MLPKSADREEDPTDGPIPTDPLEMLHVTHQRMHPRLPHG